MWLRHPCGQGSSCSSLTVAHLAHQRVFTPSKMATSFVTALRPGAFRAVGQTARCQGTFLASRSSGLFQPSAGVRRLATSSFRAKTSSSSSHASMAKTAFVMGLGRRMASTVNPYTVAGENPFTMTPAKWRQVGLTVLAIAGGTVAMNYALNRETRDALAPIERAHLNKTFQCERNGWLRSDVSVSDPEPSQTLEWAWASLPL